MKMLRSWSQASSLALVLALPCLGFGLQLAVTPVQQVVSMLEEMKAKGTSEMAVEQQVYDQYAKWVHNRTRELGFEMATQTSTIDKLTSEIEGLKASISELDRDIASLDASISQAEGDKKDATATRESAHEEYSALSQDYAESVDALERAIQTLKSQDYDRPQAEVLLQGMAKKMPALRPALASLLQTTDSGAPAVATYEFQSKSIVEVLEDLLDKFKDALQESQTDEVNSAHAYDMEVLHLDNLLRGYNADRAEKASSKGQAVTAAAQAEAELADTKATKSENAKLSSEINAQFTVKAATFQENQKVRADELKAIGEAIEILKAPEVSSSYAEHVKLVQVAHRSTSFLQMSAQSLQQNRLRRAVALLQRRARSSSSSLLERAAATLADNPFAKVIGMIETLLAKLKEEAVAEADHKAWCDDELKNNKLKREKKTLEADELMAQIDEYKAQIATMASDIEELTKEQAELTTAMREATEVRTAEKAKNTDTLADAKAGAAAVQKALAVLQDFYASQASLLQGGGKRQVPEMAAYKGMQGTKKGVVGLLEVIESDFSRLAAETEASEAQAAKEYATFMADGKASMETKHRREVKLLLEKDQAEFEKERKEKSLAGVEVELKEASNYYDYLKPNCIQIHVSYEERVARRKEEIEALKEAYNILDGKTASE
mmetsp:Transcript_54742/g.122969  ORF Transcript_54742/g.122969 Transcript_54742/m.122969 type:complete len:667 (-) Transcript_54742:34-2034(-)